MKTQNTNNKLAFNKNDVTELNDAQLENVNGGFTTPACYATVAFISFLVGAVISYSDGH